MSNVIQFPKKPIKFPECLEHFKADGGCRDGRNCDKVDPRCEMQHFVMTDLSGYRIDLKDPPDAAND